MWKLGFNTPSLPLCISLFKTIFLSVMISFCNYHYGIILFLVLPLVCVVVLVVVPAGLPVCHKNKVHSFPVS